MANELLCTFEGTPTHGLYAIIRKQEDGTVWNGTAFVSFVNGDIANYDVALTSLGGDLFGATMPADISAGDYIAIFYELVSGATPTISDEKLRAKAFHWTGTEVSVTPPVTPVGDYCDRGDIEDVFGVSNTALYSQLESTTDGSVGAGADTARMQRAIDKADAVINSAFRPYYTVPMTLSDPSDELVRHWAAILAGIEMYRARFGQYEVGSPGRPGKDNRGSHYAAWEKEVMSDIRMYQIGAASGHLLLAGATRTESSVPTVADLYGTGVTEADLARRRYRDAWRYGPWY